jgi:tetratricopeptide (TPR) repeat protein
MKTSIPKTGMSIGLALVALFTLTGMTKFEENFAAGNEAYNRGDYEASVKSYEQLIASSVRNTAVFYNLGNAYYRQGFLGYAIANYERALQMDPSFEDARDNLDMAVRDTERQTDRPFPPAWEQSLFFWHYDLSYGATRLMSLLCWLSFWGILAVRLWRPKRFVRRLAIFTLVLTLLFAGSSWVKGHPEAIAVAVNERVPVHLGPRADEQVYFELYEGDRVIADQRRAVADSTGKEEHWSRITMVSNERGWVRDADLVFVGPPYAWPSGKTVQVETEGE